MKTALTQTTLKKRFLYNRATGLFTRVVCAANHKAGSIAGHKNKSGYVALSIDERDYYAHRLAWLYVTGSWPLARLDHIDGNPSNNSWSNLRLCTHSQNCSNRPKPKTNITGFKGVTRKTGRTSYVAQIGVNNKHVYLGSYPTAEEAAAVYDAAAIKAFGPFAKINFGDE